LSDNGGSCEQFPDVPYVEIMTEVDGIPIPRLEARSAAHQIKGQIAVDVGNEFARAHPGQPATGDALVVRFSAEPKTLNSITETSAYETYMSEYVREALARQDGETLEYKPKLASRWVAEDSVKLSADYPGHVRRISRDGAAAEASLNFDYPVPVNEDEPLTVEFVTHDEAGQALGGVWVGLFATEPENMPGAPTKGYHWWSDDAGRLSVSGIVPGRYRVHVGHEVYGRARVGDEGALTVVPATEENPLHEQLGDKAEDGLTLDKGQWVDVQEQTIYTYYLRPEARWSDGEPFTARDLEFAYRVINNPYVDSESLRVYYQDLVECAPLSPHVVRMKYRQQYFKAFEFTAGLAFFTPPYHLFERFLGEDGKQLTAERLTPEQEQAQKKVSVHGAEFGRFFNLDSRYNERPIGTGPYAVEDWDRSVSITLRRRDDYWDTENRGYLDRIVFRFIPDNVTALQALKAGEIDFHYTMTPEQYFDDLAGPPEWFKGTYVKATWFSPGFSYVGWNLLDETFQDRRVRIALRLLFNVEEFLEKKLHGAGVLVSGSQYYFGPGYDRSVPPIGYDPESAAELLAEAGWIDTDNDGILDKDGKPLSFEFVLPQGNKTVEEQLALMQRSFKDAGIVATIREFEWASFIDKIKARDFDACRLSWAQPLESDPFQIWHGSGAGAGKRGSNHVSFANQDADRLIEMLRLTLDERKRECINASLHRILDREQPYMFLYTPKEFGAYHQRFQGVKWYPIRPGFDLTQWYVPKDQQLR
jgi:peptide/nickel transport system substrate-binding protein